MSTLFYLHGTDPDFIDQTLLLLSDIAAARGKPIPAIIRDNRNRSRALTPLDYPFNLILSSATIPAALAAHLEAHHPTMTRLVSPRLHRLPKHLALEFSPYNSGNRNAEVLAKLKAVWRDNALAGRHRARIVIFANARARAAEMGAYLSGNGVPNIVVTGQSNNDMRGGSRGQRGYGSNKHLAGFLKPILNKSDSLQSQPPCAGENEEGGGKAATGLGETAETKSKSSSPRVLLSTSLLARGLDFDPSVSHVFVLDPPRNTADFLHRAGRTARAGGSGKVVVFGKGAGRGAGKLREMRQRLAALRASARS